MSNHLTDPAVTAQKLADRGGRHIRRLVNRTTYEDARRRGAGVREFVCECGRLECDGVVTLHLSQFDPHSRPGAVLAHG